MAIKIPIISEYDKKGQTDAETGLQKLGKSAKRLAKIGAAAFAAVGAGALVMGKQLLNAGETAATSNARIEQITTSMGLFGDATKTVSGRLVNLAEKTARLTGVDQNLIKEGQALLLTFKNVAKDADIVGGTFDRATKAAIDMAAAGFGSVTSNAVQLGKALEDPIKGITALAKSGVTFTADQKELIKTLVETNRIAEAQDIILAAVETQVGGTAEATANASDKIKVAWSQLQENLGQKLLPAFESFSNFLIDKLIPGMEDIYLRAAPYVLEAFRRISKWMKETGIPAFQAFIEYVKQEIIPRIEDLTKKLKDLGIYVSERLVPIVKDMLKGAFESLSESVPTLLDNLNKILNVLDKIIRATAYAADGLNKVTGGKGGSLVGDLFGRLIIGPIGGIPGLAEGGIVPATPGGTLARIGEGGQAEAVIPLNKMGGMGTTYNINVNGGISTSADIGRAVVNAIKAMNRVDGPAQIQVA